MRISVCACMCGISIQMNRCQLLSEENRGFLCSSPILSKLPDSAMTKRFHKFSTFTSDEFPGFNLSVPFLLKSESVEYQLVFVSLSVLICLAPCVFCFWTACVSCHVFLRIASFFQVYLVNHLFIYGCIMSPEDCKV